MPKQSTMDDATIYEQVQMFEYPLYRMSFNLIITVNLTSFLTKQPQSLK